MLRFFIVLFSCYLVVGRNLFGSDDSEPLNCRPDEEVQCVYCPGEKTCRRPNAPGVACLAWAGQPCYEQCVCKDGRQRSHDGKCITDEECNEWKCPGAHEYLECGNICDNVCELLETRNKTNCPIYSYACSEQCYCEDGYARDGEDNCIPIEKCAK